MARRPSFQYYFTIFSGKAAIFQETYLRFLQKGAIMTAVGKSGLWLQADASRRQSGPRKPIKVSVSMVRSRCKPGRAKSARGWREGANAQSKVPAGECGVKDQVSRR